MSWSWAQLILEMPARICGEEATKSKPIHACICIRIRKQKTASVQDARCRCREASHSSCIHFTIFSKVVYFTVQLGFSQTYLCFMHNWPRRITSWFTLNLNRLFLKFIRNSQASSNYFLVYPKPQPVMSQAHP